MARYTVKKGKIYRIEYERAYEPETQISQEEFPEKGEFESTELYDELSIPSEDFEEQRERLEEAIAERKLQQLMGVKKEVLVFDQNPFAEFEGTSKLSPSDTLIKRFRR